MCMGGTATQIDDYCLPLHARRSPVVSVHCPCLSSDCRFKEAVCHFCQKKGHIAKVCKSKKREQSSAQNADMKKKKPTKTGQCNFMETGDNEDEPPSELPPTLPLFQLKEHSSHPIVVSVLVNDKPLEMELDTGQLLASSRKIRTRANFLEYRYKKLLSS